MKLKKEWVPFFTIIVIILAFGCKKSIPADRCDYDGARIEPLYGVCFSLQDGSEKRFCSIVCASMSFQELKGRIKEVMVVDEPSGNKINASEAFFIESEMVTARHVKNRIHVFLKKEDALKHLQRFKGRWIDNPFRLPAE
jgi:ribosomal protein L24E